MVSLALAARVVVRVQVKVLPPEAAVQLQLPDVNEEVFSVTPVGSVAVTVKSEPRAMLLLVFVTRMAIESAPSPCMNTVGVFW